MINGKKLPDPMPESDPNNKPVNEPRYESYIGTKVLKARPMKHHDFLSSLGKDVTNMETLGDGYELVYEDGYKSWSPKDVFDRCYRRITDAEKMIVWQIRL